MELAAVQNKSPHTTRIVYDIAIYAMSTRLFTEDISNFTLTQNFLEQTKKSFYLLSLHTCRISLSLKLTNEAVSECVGIMRI